MVEFAVVLKSGVCWQHWCLLVLATPHVATPSAFTEICDDDSVFTASVGGGEEGSERGCKFAFFQRGWGDIGRARLA
jgi:hypothetical protein